MRVSLCILLLLFFSVADLLASDLRSVNGLLSLLVYLTEFIAYKNVYIYMLIFYL